MDVVKLIVAGVEYQRHPLSSLFGDLSDEDYRLLKSSIAHVGQQRPILLAATGNNVVLDGWNRLTAINELGREPVTRVADAGQDEIQLVTAVNLAQRTLSAGQRALIASQLATYANGGAREGAGRPAQTPSTPEPTQNQSLNLDSDSFDTTATGTDDVVDGAGAPSGPQESNRLSLADAAEQLGVSRAYAARARAVEKGAIPEVIAAIKKGELSLNEAAEIARKPIETQAEYAARRIKEGTDAIRQSASENAPRSKVIAKHIKKYGKAPEDAAADEVRACVGGILLDAWLSLNVISNLLATWPDCVEPHVANQFLAGVEAFQRALNSQASATASALVSRARGQSSKARARFTTVICRGERQARSSCRKNTKKSDISHQCVASRDTG